MGSGRFVDEVYIAILQVSEEVISTRKTGKVSITLEIAPGMEGEPQVYIKEQIGRTPPKPQARGAAFYALDGELHRQDPRQQPLDFRVVAENPPEVRTAPEGDKQVREAE